MSLASQISLLAQRVRDEFNTRKPRQLPGGGALGQALVKSSAADYAVGWGNPAAADAWSYLKLAANFANSNVAFAAVTGLTFAALANTTYEVEAYGAYQAAAITTGMALAVDIPSGSVIGSTLTHISATAPGSAQQIADATTTGATASVATAASNTPVLGKFLIAVGATPGNIALMLRSEIAASAVTLQGGLFFMKWRALP